MLTSFFLACMEQTVFLTLPARNPISNAIYRTGFAALAGLATAFRPFLSSVMQMAPCTGPGGGGNCASAQNVTAPCASGSVGCGDSCSPVVGYCPGVANCWGSSDGGTCCDCRCYDNTTGEPFWCYCYGQ